jgi:hypothetical protein
MKLTVRRLVGIGAVLAALAILLLFALWPSAPAPERTAEQQDAPAPAKKAPVGMVAADITEPRKEGDVLERLGIDPEITPKCAAINQWHDRHVPMWVILDNMDAGGMVFHEFELDCLTTSPLPPGILTWAENHIDHNTNNALVAEGSGGPAAP